MQKRWRCMICGYIHVGEKPPCVCPVCNAPRKMFEPMGEDDKTEPEYGPLLKTSVLTGPERLP